MVNRSWMLLVVLLCQNAHILHEKLILNHFVEMDVEDNTNELFRFLRYCSGSMDKRLDDISANTLKKPSELVIPNSDSPIPKPPPRTPKKESQNNPLPVFDLTVPISCTVVPLMDTFIEPYFIPLKYEELTVSVTLEDMKELKRHHDLWRDDCWDHLMGVNIDDRFVFYLNAISSIEDPSTFEEKLKRGRRNYLRAVIASKIFPDGEREEAAMEMMSNSRMENFVVCASKILDEIGIVMNQLANNNAKRHNNSTNAQVQVPDSPMTCAALVEDGRTSIGRKITTQMDVLANKTGKDDSEFENTSKRRSQSVSPNQIGRSQSVSPNQIGRYSRQNSAPSYPRIGHSEDLGVQQSEEETASIITDRDKLKQKLLKALILLRK